MPPPREGIEFYIGVPSPMPKGRHVHDRVRSGGVLSSWPRRVSDLRLKIESLP